LRPPDRLPRARQLPVRPVLPGRAEEPEPLQRPDRGRPAGPPAAHAGRGEAPRADLRDPALSRQAAVLRAAALARPRERLGRGAQELRSQLRLRLRWAADGGLAGPVAEGAAEAPPITDTARSGFSRLPRGSVDRRRSAAR